MKNILLADDFTIVRIGLKALINEKLPLYSIHEAATEKQLIRCIKSNVYQLIVLDMQIPDTDFGKLMQWIKLTAPASHILIFTMFTEEMYGLRCLHMGANGFLRKTASYEDIVTAIQKST
jgi:two-component system invasion response regulator UvrY